LIGLIESWNAIDTDWPAIDDPAPRPVVLAD
jgi:hypothetical protein